MMSPARMERKIIALEKRVDELLEAIRMIADHYK